MKERLLPLEKKFKENEELLVVAETEVKDAVDISSKSKTVSNKITDSLYKHFFTFHIIWPGI